MSLLLYMDHHVPAAVTNGLRRRGIDVLTAADDGAEELLDDLLLQRATELDRVLFTQDRDFAAITNRWLRLSRPFVGVVYVHQDRFAAGRLIEELELFALVYTREEVGNRLIYLPA